MVGLNAIGQMFFIPTYSWSLAIIAVDVIALYGLVAYGTPQTPTPPGAMPTWMPKRHNPGWRTAGS